MTSLPPEIVLPSIDHPPEVSISLQEIILSENSENTQKEKLKMPCDDSEYSSVVKHKHKHKHKYEKEKHMAGTDGVNIFASSPMGTGAGMGYGGGGWGHDGFGGGGMLGGLLVGALLGRGGFGGLGGGFGGGVPVVPEFGGFGHGHCGGGGFGEKLLDTAILSKLGDIQGAIPLAACEVSAQLAEQTGDINLSTAQQTLALSNQINTGALANQIAFGNVKDSVQATAAITNANIAAATAAVNVGTLQTAIAIRDDGDKTRALISSIDRDNLSRMLSDANNVIAELKFGRENDSRQHGIEIQMINNQNQNQLQFQAQAQGIGFLQHCLNDVGQVAKATNQNVLVGNSGVTATGPQTANPTNVRV